jgi:hypothetical protein
MFRRLVARPLVAGAVLAVLAAIVLALFPVSTTGVPHPLHGRYACGPAAFTTVKWGGAGPHDADFNKKLFCRAQAAPVLAWAVLASFLAAALASATLATALTEAASAARRNPT